MDTLPPGAVTEAMAGVILTLLAIIGVIYGIYKMCTTERAVRHNESELCTEEKAVFVTKELPRQEEQKEEKENT